MKNNQEIFVRVLKTLATGSLFGSIFNISLFSPFIDRIKVNINSRGSLGTILWLKNLRVATYNYLAGTPVKVHLLSLTWDGIPTVFGPLIPFLRKSDKGIIRMVLTVLLISRVLPGWKLPDFSSITNPPTFDPKVLTDIRKKSRGILNKLGINEVVQPVWESPHISTKSGPNGIAMFAAKADFLSIPDSLMGNLKVIGGPLFGAYMNSITKDPTLLDHKSNLEGKNLLRKLSIVKDVDGKSRVIAMADYWSQSALKPLHDTLMGLLRKLKADVTYGQNIEPFGPSSESYYSYDLTTATDRIPVEIYQILLMSWFNRDYAKAWRSIMVDIPFSYQSDTLKYATGQPMGMYSSWVLMALAHHLIVQYSAQIAGSNLPFEDYRLLGDDIVIRNNAVAKAYAATMTSLGVGISPAKTLVSKDTFEFAKRFFFQGVEVTGFPINGIISALTQGSWVDIVTVISESVRRGYSAIWLLNPVHLRELVTISPRCGWNESFRIYRKIATMYCIQEGFIGNATQKVALLWDLPVSCVTDINSFREAFYMQLLQESSALASRVSQRVEGLLSGSVESAFANSPDLSSSTPPESGSDFPDMDSWLMGGVTHEKSVYGPIEWVLRDSSMKLQAAISQAMQLQLSGNFRSVEDLYSLIFKDLNPQVFTLENMDKRRITARQFGFMSSLSILSIKGLKD